MIDSRGFLVGDLCCVEARLWFCRYLERFTRCFAGHVIGIDLRKVGECQLVDVRAQKGPRVALCKYTYAGAVVYAQFFDAPFKAVPYTLPCWNFDT